MKVEKNTNGYFKFYESQQKHRTVCKPNRKMFQYSRVERVFKCPFKREIFIHLAGNYTIDTTYLP